ncbi:MAG TPA: translation initiation factor IF-2 subunit alpha [Thermoplasmatales archaeon]|nr:translation initiation factor IF-2 subunit alpha [Thermoplasmatales archaeon]
MIKELPEKGELVVCTVKKAKGFGAFVELDEYPDKRGFIHIKEVASGWVKNIRDYVREGQRIVCKVMDIDPSKGYVDLSLKRVNEHQRREKIQQWKNEQKAKKLFEMLAEKIGKGEKECYEEFGYELINKFGSLYDAFEEVVRDEKALEKEGFQGEWIEEFINIAKENIPIPNVEIEGYVEMMCPGPRGIEHIRKALKMMEGKKGEVEVTVKYISAPLYRVEAVAPDYKSAEKVLKEKISKGLEYITQHGGVGTFKRELK